ncbi:MAG: hypothetical protein JWO53_912, partial [Chlamydiia bacterium]|nr:hypothetical protein [Chlamydiia bacterium]
MLTSKETAYSHGLEKIYNFEVVDPSTVRKLSVPVSSSQPVGEKPTKVPDNQEAIFNFGAQFEIKMTSLRLEEPLDSLDLSPFAMKALTSYG